MFKRFNEGTALILATTIMLISVIVVGSLMSVSHSDTQMHNANLSLMTAKYSARGALSATVVALNLSDEILELQGSSGNWESIIVKLSDNSWKQLSNKLGDIESKEALRIYQDRGKDLALRPSMDFQVKIKEYGDENFIAYATAVTNKLKKHLKAFLLIKNKHNIMPGIFGDKEVQIRGTVKIDSYNSENGNYSAMNIAEKGDVKSNGSISLDGNSYIYGDARPGPEQLVNNPEKVSGKTDSLEQFIELTPVEEDWQKKESNTFPTKDKKITLNNLEYHYKNIRLNNELIIQGNVTLYCHGDFECMAKSQIILENNAKITIYVAGKTKFTGKLDIKNSSPKDFMIKSCYKSDTSPDIPEDNFSSKWGVVISGTSNVHMVVYAPKTSILVAGNNEFYGSVIGYVVRITGSAGNSTFPNKHNAKFHYDEALKDTKTTEKNRYYIAEILPDRTS